MRCIEVKLWDGGRRYLIPVHAIVGVQENTNAKCITIYTKEGGVLHVDAEYDVIAAQLEDDNGLDE